MLVSVIRPHMKEKNVAAVAQLGDFYSGPAFLDFVSNSAALVKERDSLLGSLSSFMTARGGSVRRRLLCVTSGCELPRLNIRGA